MRKIVSLLVLTRPVNAGVCALSVVCGGIIGGKPADAVRGIVSGVQWGALPPWALRLAAASLSASLILAAGNVFNDVRDAAADSVNAPNRPIPSVKTTPSTAAIFALVLATLGVALSAPLGVPGVLVAGSAAALLFAYDMKLKGVPLAGNLAVAALGGTAFIYGGIAGGSVHHAVVPALFAMLLHLGREIIKDAADYRGDVSAGTRTAATVWGAVNACRLASAVLLALVAATFLPFAAGCFGPAYITIVAAGVWPPVVYSIVLSRKNPSEARLRRASAALKLSMPTGIVAILAGFQGC